MVFALIKSIHSYPNNVYVVGLEALDNNKKFFPGQHIKLNLDLMDSNFANIPFTIASSPHSYPYLELHIRDTGNKLISTAIQSIKDNMRTGKKQNISFPHGNCYFDDTYFKDDLIFVSWGTGFSQAKSIIEYIFHHQYKKSIYLFQIVKDIKNLYQESTIIEWSNLDNFQYQIIVRQKLDNQPLNLYTNVINLCNSIFSQVSVLNQKRFFIAGPPSVSKDLISELIERNVKLDRIHSDIDYFRMKKPIASLA
jgi:NAD(P)H-flavin reductase